jgi:RNA polymerase sigma-70 factor, ECF subfamily
MDNEQLRHWLRQIHEKSDGWEAASEQFAEWFMGHDEQFDRIAYRILSNREEAVDVVQDTAIKLSITGVQPPREQVFNWCCRIVRNRSIDILRAKERQPYITDNETALEQSPNRPSDDPSYGVEDEEFSRIYAEAKEKALTPRQAQIVQRIEDGYKNPEIAQELDVPIRTVEREKSRAIQRLRAYLETHHPEYARQRR